MRFVTPPAFAADIAGREGAEGSRWLAALPGLVADLCHERELRPDGQVRYGYVAVVLPVRRPDGEPAALKVTYPGPDQAPEAPTLQAWAGDGAVRLLDFDAPRWALLLERLDPMRDLCPVPMEDAIAVIGGLQSRLHRVEPPADVPRLADTARRWAREIPQLWAQVGPPWPRRLLDEVTATCRDAAAVTCGDALLHVDLHFANVLGAEREPWLAIDPKGLAGDPAFESVAVLWNRVEEYDGGARAVARRLHAWCEAAAVDREVARAWARARIVEDALDRLGGVYGAAERDVGAHELLMVGLER